MEHLKSIVAADSILPKMLLEFKEYLKNDQRGEPIKSRIKSRIKSDIKTSKEEKPNISNVVVPKTIKINKDDVVVKDEDQKDPGSSQ